LDAHASEIHLIDEETVVEACVDIESGQCVIQMRAEVMNDMFGVCAWFALQRKILASRATAGCCSEACGRNKLHWRTPGGINK
jgi:hypothetical protein